ncbi:hypothetical protein K1719_040175 [Acacia pycnantha]|nr:hypothetical protein K1719_040175 [Acacia pycnantha]
MLYEPAFNSSDTVNFSTASNPLAESSRLMTMPQFASSDLLSKSNATCTIVFSEQSERYYAGYNQISFIQWAGSEMTQQTDQGMWVGNGNQLFLVPNYGILSNQLRLGNPNFCTNRTIHSDESSGHRVSDSNNQGFSLSLSSNSQCSKPLRSVSNHSSNAGDRTGPDVSGGVGASTSADVANATIESGVSTKNSCSGATSFSMLQCSNGNENSGDGGGNRRSSRPSSRPEYQQRMAKFPYMQQEVIRRYRQHQQQMQMLIPSFESVAGLSSATPYISNALKPISRHFRCHIRGVLGEELSATTSGGASPPVTNMTSATLRDRSSWTKAFKRTNSLRGVQAMLNTNSLPGGQSRKACQNVPPTDADKHMLAARTGFNSEPVGNHNLISPKGLCPISVHVPNSIRAEVEVGGAGPVSLTLALKRGDVEAIQQHHHQLSRHLRGHVINDFVGQ